MDFKSERIRLNQLIEEASEKKNKLTLYIIGSTKENTVTKTDYAEHSITTSYLSLVDLQEIIMYFQSFEIYTVLYNDVEEYLSDYYNGKIKDKPQIIFETSPKGIGRGKDALIPCVCDMEEIRHLGPSANVNCLCSSKYQWTSILKAHKIPVPESFFYIGGEWVSSPPRNVKYIVKLNYECASIGLTDSSVMVNNGYNLESFAKDISNKYAQSVIAQEFISGYEVEVPILINSEYHIVLPPVGLSYQGNKNLGEIFLNYDTIYNDDYNFYDFSKEQPNMSEKIIKCVKKIISVLDLNGYMRVDFRVKADGNFYVIDINNDPCINSHGSFLASITYLGLSKADIAPILIGNCLK